MKSLRLHGVHQSQNFGDVHGGDTPRAGAIPRVLTARELEFLRLRQLRTVCPWGWGLCGWGRLWEGRNGAGKLEPTVAKETNELPGGGSVPSWPGNNRKQNGKGHLLGPSLLQIPNAPDAMSVGAAGRGQRRFAGSQLSLTQHSLAAGVERGGRTLVTGTVPALAVRALSLTRVLEPPCSTGTGASPPKHVQPHTNGGALTLLPK